MREALLEPPPAWLRGRGDGAMVGPADFAMNDESGMLIEGYELRPMIRQPWHPPYYKQPHGAGRDGQGDGPADVEPRGLRPRAGAAGDLRAGRQGASPSTASACARCAAGSCARTWTRFAEIYNSAWSKNWDFVPYSKKDLDAYAQEMHLVVRQALGVHRRERRTPARSSAMAMTLPGHQPGAREDEGQTAAARLAVLPAQEQDHDRVRVGFLGVKPEYQHTGVAAKLYVRTFQRRRAPPAERRRDGLDPRDEHGDEPRHGSDGRAVVKRYRVYERALA